MISKNRFKWVLVCIFILILGLYVAIIFQPIGVIDFQYAQVLLFSAQSLLFLTFIFIILAVFNSKGIINSVRMKKIMFSSLAIVLFGLISLLVYGCLTCYNCYTPEDIVDDEEYMQSFTPYHDIIDNKKENIDLAVSHIPGTDYMFLYCYGTYDYEIEYFSSISPFLMWKFKTERSIFTPLSEFYIDVLVPGEEVVIDGEKVIAFIDENDYAVLIKSFNQAVYCSLIDVSTDEITFDEFAREAINQMKLFKEAKDRKTFLDVPLLKGY